MQIYEATVNWIKMNNPPIVLEYELCYRSVGGVSLMLHTQTPASLMYMLFACAWCLLGLPAINPESLSHTHTCDR